MYYKVKPRDTLTKIARYFSIPVELILAHNPTIKDPSQIRVKQEILIPNIDDVPILEFNFSTLNANDIIDRARSAVNAGIRYKLGSGGTNPNLKLPTSNKFCDCSGFVCWTMRISRKTDIPFYRRFGGWIYTDSMVEDIKSNAGIFEKLNVPEPGCIVVFGAGEKIGHVGIISSVRNGLMNKVIHCSSGNDRKYSDSIQETSPEIFDRADAMWGRFVG